jgi:hypothetical protein
MKSFAKGVSYYTHCTVDIHFPEDDICCMWCPLMGNESGSHREYCRKTGEYLPAPRDLRGERCPLVFSVDEETGELK